ncbi:hypothetical protein DK265_00090 [Pseudomonas aeruginosa]|uniref:SirB2 family protein n=1 Tax=Pseudomonas aeruginosa TaxID=287 RepID=UPI000D6EEA98|nr:SirB2 family protein [Pseudomonas aeruginosa]ELK4919533.1 SirB2 family protein [Pseudomonas aeruginosa]MCP9254321.1 SirB2 family protein [Pseudomonas aeruginosa]MCS8549187.1 SirB2 family protein [Pseudomonas aeruginosa]MCT1239351.1 SirB2 family protein [Pseudomonas aeruginosa]PWU41519.1 hypothetical protein DK265_00090 [Pseudomonas aeruginosa]
MIEFYFQIKWVHVAAIMVSGTLFAMRGGAALIGMRWPMVAPVRYLSYAVDTVLLTAAMMLFSILPGSLFANGWLLVKLALVVVYILLGRMAMKQVFSQKARALLYLAALLTYLQIYATARAHHPLGLLSLWFAGGA